MNIKYGILFANQSQNATEKCETTEKSLTTNQNAIEHSKKAEASTKSAYQRNLHQTFTGKSLKRIIQPTKSQNQSNSFILKKIMDREYSPSTAEIMKIVIRRRKSPETLRLVERRLEISRPGTMRRKFDLNAQRQIWIASRPNKRSREEIAEPDKEMLSRANRLGGGYQSLEERIEENPPQEEIEENGPEREGESQIIRRDNYPIVDLKAYNTDRKEAQFLQINQIFDKITGDKKATEETIKKANSLSCSTSGL